MLIVGLGNPGQSYDKTKHNFGFWVLDRLVEKSSLKWQSGYGDYVYAKDKDLILAKPTTFMNNSGLAVKDLCNHYNQTEIIIVYDDIDLPLGTLRFRKNGSPGGHKGIESIIYHLKTDQFNRLKLGIALEGINMRPSEHFVLKPFPKQYHEEIEIVISKSVDALDYYFNNGIKETMNQFN